MSNKMMMMIMIMHI